MEKKSKRDDDDELLAAGEAPLQKSAKQGGTTAENDAEAILAFEISAKRRVTVNNWRGVPMVNIREYYEKDGRQLPGKKGISLTIAQWKVLREHVDAIDKAVAEKS